MNKKSKIYIAGHAGLVGSAVLRTYHNRGFVNIITRARQELDLFNQKTVDEFFAQERPEYVVDCAARVGGIKANMNYPADFLYENLQIQNNIIWSALKYDVKKLLFLGSSCIYPRECPQPMKEEYLLSGKLEPTNEGYALAKIAGIKLCESIYEQYGRTFISCMPANIYGVGDNFNDDYSHVISALIRRIYEAKMNRAGEVIVWGTGNSRREFLYVDDLADAICWLMDNYDEKNYINIGASEDISIKELAFLIKGIIGYEGNLMFDKTKPDGMPRKLLDTSRLSRLGWKSKTSLRRGLKLTLEHYVKEVYDHS